MDEDATVGSIAHVMSPKRDAVVYRWATAKRNSRGGHGLAKSASSTWNSYETSQDMIMRW
jgi:hypothetical protein